MRAGMIIDVHSHFFSPDDEQKLLRAAERYNIAKIFVSTVMWGYTCHNPSEREIDLFNDITFEGVGRHPGLFRGYVYINPRNKNALDVLRRGVEDKGAIGVKLWVAAFCDDPPVNPIYEACIAYDIPLLVHAFYKAAGRLEFESTGVNVANAARRYPEAKIIMAHLGANCYHGVKAVRNCPNVWVDICGTICRGGDLDYAVKAVGCERILFGTDANSWGSNYGLVMDAELTDAQRDMIFRGNAARLFKLGEAV